MTAMSPQRLRRTIMMDYDVLARGLRKYRPSTVQLLEHFHGGKEHEGPQWAGCDDCMVMIILVMNEFECKWLDDGIPKEYGRRYV